MYNYDICWSHVGKTEQPSKSIVLSALAINETQDTHYGRSIKTSATWRQHRAWVQTLSSSTTSMQHWIVTRDIKHEKINAI